MGIPFVFLPAGIWLGYPRRVIHALRLLTFWRVAALTREPLRFGPTQIWRRSVNEWLWLILWPKSDSNSVVQCVRTNGTTRLIWGSSFGPKLRLGLSDFCLKSIRWPLRTAGRKKKSCRSVKTADFFTWRSCRDERISSAIGRR